VVKTQPLMSGEWLEPACESDRITSDDRPDTLDMGLRWNDLKRISRTLPEYRYCVSLGWAKEDLDQELLTRCYWRQGPKTKKSKGKIVAVGGYWASRYDPKRGSVTKYLVTFSKGTLLNLAEKRNTLLKKEQVGLKGYNGEIMDAAQVARHVWDGCSDATDRPERRSTRARVHTGE
jgi:hypothetical protein